MGGRWGHLPLVNESNWSKRRASASTTKAEFQGIFFPSVRKEIRDICWPHAGISLKINHTALKPRVPDRTSVIKHSLTTKGIWPSADLFFLSPSLVSVFMTDSHTELPCPSAFMMQTQVPSVIPTERKQELDARRNPRSKLRFLCWGLLEKSLWQWPLWKSSPWCCELKNTRHSRWSTGEKWV